LIAAKKKSMSFQSSKINAETVLHFPGGVATAQILRSEVLSSQQGGRGLATRFPKR